MPNRKPQGAALQARGLGPAFDGEVGSDCGGARRNEPEFIPGSPTDSAFSAASGDAPRRLEQTPEEKFALALDIKCEG